MIVSASLGMRNLLWGVSVFVLFFSCKNPKADIGTFGAMTAMGDSASTSEGYLPETAQAGEDIPEPVEADELFEDFVFNYATDSLFQRQRTVFPLPYYNVDTPLRIEKEQWRRDSLFTDQTCYTLLFDREEDMDLMGDTALSSVQVEWIFLKTRMVKRYCFERSRGMWMLKAVDLRKMERKAGRKNADFITFYARFAVDSLYQREHICRPLQFVTVDPDDEFSILETTLEVDQWYVFKPALPVDPLPNINYGQKNEDGSSTKILKVNGMSNGYSNTFYFRRKGSEWELYKYEDTGV